MIFDVDELFKLFERFGDDGYGEDISLERHMLQSAVMAQSLGAPDPLVVAALLHDVGYFLHAAQTGAVDQGRDFCHETLGAQWLAQGFDDRVTAPIALHVQTKRYLCAAQPGYFDQLSAASKRSLALQGGVMSPDEAVAFPRAPGFEAAILLRRCDDGGKDVSVGTRSLESFRALLTACLSDRP